MNPNLSVQEYDRLEALIRSAWLNLNQAGDTPDSHRSLLSLQAAVDTLLSADAALHADSTLDSALERHHHSLLNRQPDAAGILRALSTRTGKIRRNPNAPRENVADASLAHSAIPVIWRMLRGIRHEVRSLRPPSYYARLTRRLVKSLLAFAALALLLQAVWLALPWGCLISYSSGDRLDSIRGWNAATALVQDHGWKRPLPWMRRDGWSAQWRGILLVPESAEYAFFSQCSGGMRLWIDGVPLIDDWNSPGWEAGQHARRTLDKGPHDIRLEYRDRGGRSALRVRWTGGPIPPNTVVGFPHLRKY